VAPVDAAVADYVRTRHGVLALGEARSLDLTDRQIEYRVTSRRWTRLHRGVYLVGSERPSPVARCRAAVLATGDDAVVSHRTAAALWGLLPHGGPVHVTSPRKLERRAGITPHWTRSPPGAMARHGIPVTLLGRTLDDVAMQGDVEMEPLLRSAERLHGLDRTLLRPGARGVTFARGHLIALLLQLCDEAGFVPPETEYELLGYEIDAAWPAQRIAVEVDDYAHHDNRDAMDRDRARDRRLLVAGWTPLRVTHAHLTDGRAALADELRAIGAPQPEPSTRRASARRSW
jgi:hypothetical protein